MLMLSAIKTLFLVDDSNRFPFWQNESCWGDSNWDSFNVIKLDGNIGTTSDQFIEKINRYKDSNTFFIVTDGYFGDNQYGGNSLLEAFLDDRMFQRGVLYSDDPNITDNVALSGKVVAFTRSNQSERCQDIRQFFESGEKLSEFLNGTRIKILSRAIHAICNLFLPLECDLETLGKLQGYDDDTIREIIKDYFGEQPPGYLMDGHVFTKTDKLGTGFVEELGKILAPCQKLFNEMIKFPDKTPEWLKTFLTRGGDLNNIIMLASMRVFEARGTYKNDLQNALAIVSSAGHNIISILRDLRT